MNEKEAIEMISDKKNFRYAILKDGGIFESKDIELVFGDEKAIVFFKKQTQEVFMIPASNISILVYRKSD
jgi:hypothetical protein